MPLKKLISSIILIFSIFIAIQVFAKDCVWIKSLIKKELAAAQLEKWNKQIEEAKDFETILDAVEQASSDPNAMLTNLRSFLKNIDKNSATFTAIGKENVSVSKNGVQVKTKEGPVTEINILFRIKLSDKKKEKIYTKLSKIIALLPRGALFGVKEIVINKGHLLQSVEGMASQKKRMHFYSHRITGSSITMSTFYHELGHLMALDTLSKWEPRGYAAAIEKDQNRVSYYADTDVAEDFAETMAVYLATHGGNKVPEFKLETGLYGFNIKDNLKTLEPEKIRQRFKNRFEFIDHFLVNGNYFETLKDDPQTLSYQFQDIREGSEIIQLGLILGRSLAYATTFGIVAVYVFKLVTEGDFSEQEAPAK